MPLTEFQKQLAQFLAKNRSPDSHLAGGAVLHFQPNSIRFVTIAIIFTTQLSVWRLLLQPMKKTSSKMAIKFQ